MTTEKKTKGRTPAAGKKAGGASGPAEKTARPRTPSAPETVPEKERYYCFKIQLDGIKPAIWREFFVPAGTSLHCFHEIIQTVMGWENDHLYAFEIFGETYYDPEANPFEPSEILNEVFLHQFRFKKGSSLKYQYDFGDDWYHTIKMTNPNYLRKDPQQESGCLAGARACPPEDCGGPWGYYQILELKEKPDEKSIYMGWAEEFEPEEFSLDAINAWLD
jgi:hypothetical protein